MNESAYFCWLAIALASMNCGQPPANTVEEPAARRQPGEHKGADMAADALANPAPDPLFASFSDKVREFSLRFGADLTPNRAASIVGSSATSDAPGRWSIKLQHESEVIMKAESADAQVRWLAFMLSREFGLILEQLLPIYGDQYQALEGQKDGTDIFYESPKAGSVVPGTRIAVRLWTRDAAPRSEVIKLNLQRPDE